MATGPKTRAIADRITRYAKASEKWLPWVCVIGLFLFYGIYFSFITVQNHWNLRTAAYDLAIEDNIVFNATRGELLKGTPMFGPEGTHLGYHATFFAYVLAPIYYLHPRAETLLVIQAVMMGAAVIPLFLFARTRLGPWAGVLLAAMYVLYAPLHGANLYDFHYPPLGIVFVMWAAFLMEREGQLDGRFGCATPEEAVASQRLFAAALESQKTGSVVALS